MKDRRIHKGPIVPTIFLVLEIILISIGFHIITVGDSEVTRSFYILASLVYFVRSSLVRYFRVLTRN